MNSLFGGGWKPEDEDCSRVFTTSRGQVTIAPAVPATLREIQGKSAITDAVANARLLICAHTVVDFSTGRIYAERIFMRH